MHLWVVLLEQALYKCPLLRSKCTLQSLCFSFTIYTIFQCSGAEFQMQHEKASTSCFRNAFHPISRYYSISQRFSQSWCGHYEIRSAILTSTLQHHRTDKKNTRRDEAVKFQVIQRSQLEEEIKYLNDYTKCIVSTCIKKL